MEFQTKMIAARLKGARELMDISVEEMAKRTDKTVEQYLALERGVQDFSVTFLYKCAEVLRMDVSEIISGEAPKLNFYNLTRSGEGMPVKRREGLNYRHLAPFLKNRTSEPFIVTAQYDEKKANSPIELSVHKGHELDFILKGSLKIRLEDHIEVLHEGDSIYYDSSHPHGMVAIDGESCTFMAVVFHPEDESDIEPQLLDVEKRTSVSYDKGSGLIYKNFVNETINERGHLENIEILPPEGFNFAYDVVDALAKKSPDKTALIHLTNKKKESKLSFSEVSRMSTKCASFFKELGINKGDRVMLVLKRDHRFWYSILALHKLGAVAIPATALLTTKDYDYRFKAAGVKAVVCANDSYILNEVDGVDISSTSVELKIVSEGARDGWINFDDGVESASETIERVPVDNDDPMIMFFTSGTTGYPKIATHSYTYPLGHIVTARWWHNVDPNGVHFTISDTGWGKALWGKLYGQWLCETAIFVYDFDKFNASDLLPLFKQYNITTFCAPPTMFRFFIKEDLSKYDLSSLKYATIAGEALNPEVFYQFKKATGITLMEGFGQTETTLTVGNLFGMTPKPGSMGKPNPQYDIALLKDDGSEAKVGEVGEIVVRTDKKKPIGLFSGYYKNKEQTDETWYDGVYHSGDTAWRDEDGYFWFVGRTDDVIKSSGYRIGPFEIESVIMELPYVLECAVTGVPDEMRGQVVKATVVLTKGTEPSEALKTEIKEYVKSHTAPYKYPRIVSFVESLPKTISGKIIRKNL